MNKSNKKDFFDKLAVECRTMDTNSVAHTYNGLVRLIRNELPKRKILELPELGIIKIIDADDDGYIQKYDTKTKTIKAVRRSPSLRFSINSGLKKSCKYALNDIWRN